MNSALRNGYLKMVENDAAPSNKDYRESHHHQEDSDTNQPNQQPTDYMALQCDDEETGDNKSHTKSIPTWAHSIQVITKNSTHNPTDTGPPLIHQYPLNDSLIDPVPDWQNPIPPITPISSQQFLHIVKEVRLAIQDGIQPLRIKQGSSGSYFCRNRDGDIIGVFKPKNEEPYGKLNPKWVKWLHKNLFPCCFGRSCLIPNLGYISEAAASFVDRRLGLGVVPRTEVVSLSSPAFFYGPLDRAAYGKKSKPLPPKLGSFQLFLRGYKDATMFFRDGYEQALQISMSTNSSLSHLPGDEISMSKTRTRHGINNNAKSKNIDATTTLNETTPITHSPSLPTQYTEYGSLSCISVSPLPPVHDNNPWTEKTQLEFQYGFERLVVLDYLIRNTDRGLDNWMLKYSPELTVSSSQSRTDIDTSRILNDENSKMNSSKGSASHPQSHHRPDITVVSSETNVQSPISGVSANTFQSAQSTVNNSRNNTVTTADLLTESSTPKSPTTPKTPNVSTSPPLIPDVSLASRSIVPSLQTLSPSAQVISATPPITPLSAYYFYHQIPDTLTQQPSIRVAAIDNGLAFPFKHPDRIRSYPYGWAALPCARVPFSADTRALLLPLLTSQEWWKETFEGLEKLFRIDPDFKEDMWTRQKAVMRGQGYNLVEVLRRSELNTSDTGSPWALVRRPVVAVFEEEVDNNFPEGSSGLDGVGGHQGRRRFRRMGQRFETLTSQPCFTWW